MSLLAVSDVADLCLTHDTGSTYDPKSHIWTIVPPMPSATVPSRTLFEQLGVGDIRAFLRGICLLASFIYAPAAHQLQRQLEAMDAAIA